MAKWKFKIADKLINSKTENKSENQDYQNNSDYFSNIVPPINNKFETTNKSEVDNVREIKNVKVTSSFVIPLNENLNQQPQSQNNLNNFFESQSFNNQHTVNTKALISFKDSFKIPKAISFEIKIEKLKQLMLVCLSLITITISSIFIAFYFSNFNLIYTPHPVLTIPLVIFSLMIFLVNCNDFLSLKKEVNLYIEKTLKGSLMPPSFIIRNYRKIHGRLIIFNWVFVFSYIILGITTGIMYLISGQKITFFVQSWTVIVPNLMANAITLSVVLAVLFFVHMMNIVFFKKRKNNIISYYGYEVINPTDLELYKKKINRICLIITISFIAIIFFAISIPIFVLRKKRKKV